MALRILSLSLTLPEQFSLSRSFRPKSAGVRFLGCCSLSCIVFVPEKYPSGGWWEQLYGQLRRIQPVSNVVIQQL